MHTAAILAGISWDPQLRGILSVLVGVVVLMGSVYLILMTNLAARLGFLVALAALFGWMTIHGMVWWIYPPAQGPSGRTPSWDVQEIVYGDLSSSMLDAAHELDPSALPPPDDVNELTPEQVAALNDEDAAALGEWTLLDASDATRGDAQTTLDEVLGEGVVPGLEEGDSRVFTYAFETGGKPERSGDSIIDRVTNRITNTLRITNPPHYVIVQFQPAAVEPAGPGQPPNQPEIIEGSQTVSAVLERDIGQRRVPAALLTIGSGLMFGLLCVMMHRRDRLVAEHRSAPTPAPAGS